ncbi:MAG: Uncharacterized protein Athens071425_1 [Parcubacteria group bacterium Athens0714_25]|nr:MAG: Uncharacterized protein Athens071425_1 [Parcubacteria group bacterium Athens0714_25]
MFEIIRESFLNLGESISGGWQILSHIWFIVLPPVLYYLFKLIWMDFVQNKFLGSLQWVMLEIIPPREIERSPQPMESIFNGLTGVYKGLNAKDLYVDGALTLSFSLELVSDAGQVHFYIRTTKQNRGLVESHIYAQYPDAEILEVPDYTNDVPKIIPNKTWELWGTDFMLIKPDAYPIRSYSWFEESVTGKMIDPLSSLVEAMGTAGPGQQLWFQIIIIPEELNYYNSGRVLIDKLAGRVKKENPGILSGVGKDFVDVIKGVFQGIFSPVEFSPAKENKKEEVPLEFRLTPGEKDAMKAIEESMGKAVFLTKIRFLVVGKRQGFDRSIIGAFMGGVRQFSDSNLNGFKHDNTSKTYGIHWGGKMRTLYRQRKIFQRYKDRDPTGTKFFLNTEELATIFHFPDMAVVAPSVRKVESKRGGAPSNLPI